jgi:hypothetical protein
MSEVQKGFRMPSELAEAVERMAIARGLSFSALVVEALNEKVAGKVPEEAKAAAIEVSDFVKALQEERRSQNQLTDILDKLTRHYTSTLEDRGQILATLRQTHSSVEKATEVLESLTKSTTKAADDCKIPLEKLKKSVSYIDTFIEGPVGSVDKFLKEFNATYKNVEQKLHDHKSYSLGEISRLTKDYESIINNYRSEVVAQTKSFVVTTTERWLLVACVLVVSVFIGGGGLSAWLYFNNDSGILKLKKDVKLSQQDNFFYQKEACLNRKADIHPGMCKLKGLMETNWENPYPSKR